MGSGVSVVVQKGTESTELVLGENDVSAHDFGKKQTGSDRKASLEEQIQRWEKQADYVVNQIHEANFDKMKIKA